MIHIWTDGATKYYSINKKKYDKIGHSFTGIIVKNNNDEILKEHNYVGILDNNQAEYVAFIRSLEICIEKDFLNVTFYCDNNLLVKQITGEYGVYSDLIIPYYEKAMRNISQLQSYEIILISRKENKDADNLTKLAMKDFFKN